MDSLPDFPPKLKTLVLHMILSHHGKLEFGSPKLPMIPEALVLSFIDDLDAKMQAMQGEFDKCIREGKGRRRADRQGLGARSAAVAEYAALAGRKTELGGFALVQDLFRLISLPDHLAAANGVSNRGECLWISRSRIF